MTDVKQLILDATNGGLDIILYYYPQADEVKNTNKQFKIRDEKTASACLKQFNSVWKVTDFGDDSVARNCFDIVMREENLTFSQALWLLADRYNIDCSYKKEINKPDTVFRDAYRDEKPGQTTWDVKAEPSHEDLKALGEFVTKEVMAKYNVFALNSYSYTYTDKASKLDKTIVTKSNANYPIYMFDYGEFQKIVCPYAPDKKDRFRYAGKKPADVIYGMEQIKKAYNTLQLEKGKDEHKDKKLPEIILCSGERDALNCAGMGYFPIWLNSETARNFGNKEIHNLLYYAERIINIPDSDSTGVAAAMRKSLENWELYTLLLPEWLKDYRDRRGNPRKDLCDWCELRGSRYEFSRMLETAKRCQFWDVVYKKDGVKYEINTIHLLWYLRCCGFHQIEDPVSGQTLFVHKDKYIIKPYTAKQIRAFIKRELTRLHVPNTIQRLFQDSKKTNSSLMDDLEYIDVDFTKSTPTSRTFFFLNKAIEVTADDVKDIDKGNISKYTWESNISPHNFKRLDKAIDCDKKGNFIFYHATSNYLKVMINTSRMYWREEYENRATGNEVEDNLYYEEHKFDITGSRLTQAEQDEQLLHLASKCYAIGYLLHQYKVKSNAKALWILENRLSEDGESSGGSGKSFFIEAIEKFKMINAVTLSGREKGLTENKHVLDRINKWTDILFVDDARQHFDFDFFYTLITGKTTVNPKGEKSFEIDYKDSPIPVFASNFPPQRGNDRSTLRRLLMVIYSDYYHEKGKGELYRETRKISDETGDIAEDNYSEEAYNADINFLVDCVQFYLKCRQHNWQPIPPMENIMKRINMAVMGNSGFEDWAEAYFAKDSDNLDVCIRRDLAFADFQTNTGNRMWSPQKFMEALRAFCENNTERIIALNPRELMKDGKRIVRKVDGKTHECIYIQTQHEILPRVKGAAGTIVNFML